MSFPVPFCSGPGNPGAPYLFLPLIPVLSGAIGQTPAGDWPFIIHIAWGEALLAGLWDAMMTLDAC